MIKFVLISALVVGASAGYASSQYAGAGTSNGVYNQLNTGQNSYADKYPYTNTGYNGGFTSQYAGPNGVGAAAGSGAFIPGFAPFQPVPAFPNAFDFNSFYQGLQANFANAAATQAYATGGATAVASASQFAYPTGYHHQAVQYNNPHQQQQQHQHQHQRGQQNSASSNSYHYGNNGHGYHNYENAYNLYQQQLAHQNALFNQIRQQQAFAANAAAGSGAGVGGGYTSGGNYGGPGYAGASASYGPGGVHQTAHIYPQNPQSPNIDTRFGGDSQQQGGPGFVGVSSFSSSSNINGQSHREASTTVNDNGKVTTYHVRS